MLLNTEFYEYISDIFSFLKSAKGVLSCSVLLLCILFIPFSFKIMERLFLINLIKLLLSISFSLLGHSLFISPLTIIFSSAIFEEYSLLAGILLLISDFFPKERWYFSSFGRIFILFSISEESFLCLVLLVFEFFYFSNFFKISYFRIFILSMYSFIFKFLFLFIIIMVWFTNSIMI